jgi:hypothetical protein
MMARLALFCCDGVSSSLDHFSIRSASGRIDCRMQRPFGANPQFEAIWAAGVARRDSKLSVK